MVIIGLFIVIFLVLFIYGCYIVFIEFKYVNGIECLWIDEVLEIFYGYVYYVVEFFIIIFCMVSLIIFYFFVGKVLRVYN